MARYVLFFGYSLISVQFLRVEIPSGATETVEKISIIAFRILSMIRSSCPHKSIQLKLGYCLPPYAARCEPVLKSTILNHRFV